MLAVLFSFAVSIMLIAGSLEIDTPALAGAQLVAGVWFAIAGAITGWQEAHRRG